MASENLTAIVASEIESWQAQRELYQAGTRQIFKWESAEQEQARRENHDREVAAGVVLKFYGDYTNGLYTMPELVNSLIVKACNASRDCLYERQEVYRMAAFNLVQAMASAV